MTKMMQRLWIKRVTWVSSKFFIHSGGTAQTATWRHGRHIIWLSLKIYRKKILVVNRINTFFELFFVTDCLPKYICVVHVQASRDL